MSNCCENSPLVAETESHVGDWPLVCLHCGSDELYETRTILQLVRATETPAGFNTQPLAEEDVIEFGYACADCDRELTEDTLVPISRQQSETQLPPV